MDLPKEIRELVEVSGNTFHARVARWFQANHWEVVVSPYYMDQMQNKPREIDLVAERAYPVPSPGGGKLKDLAVRLFVECKYLSSYSAIWFDAKDRDRALELVCAGGVFTPRNSHTQRHHYLAKSPTVAKLFATSRTPNTDNDPFYRALNQVLNGMIAKRGRPVVLAGSSRERLRPSIELPVIVCNSFEKLYSLSFDDDTDPRPITEPFQMEVRYAYSDGDGERREEYFLIDVIEFGRLDDFLKTVGEDARAAALIAAS